MGRALLESDDDPAATRVAVISDRLWRRRFHADPRVIGRGDYGVRRRCSQSPASCRGSSHFPPPTWSFGCPCDVTPAFKMWFQVVARLKPGITDSQAGSALRILARQLEQEDPKQKTGLRLDIAQWTETVDRKYELTLVFVLAAVGLVLLIGCADVGSLLLSRAVQRQREIAIRASLGAGLWRVARQLMTESLVLAVFGSVVGISCRALRVAVSIEPTCGAPDRTSAFAASVPQWPGAAVQHRPLRVAIDSVQSRAGAARLPNGHSGHAAGRANRCGSETDRRACFPFSSRPRLRSHSSCWSVRGS